MGSVLRSVGAVMAGLAVGVAVIAAVEGVSSSVYPLPAGLDPTNMDALKAQITQLPLGAFLFVLAAWGLGSLLGSWLATRLGPGRHLAHGIIDRLFSTKLPQPKRLNRYVLSDFCALPVRELAHRTRTSTLRQHRAAEVFVSLVSFG